MPQSHAFILVHVIFSKKSRVPYISPKVSPDLHSYLATVARNAECACYRVGGVADHVHLAIRLARPMSIAGLVEDVKSSSSKWIKTQSHDLSGFAWQKGSGAFSLGPLDRQALIDYIDSQEEHNRRKTIQEEYRAFLER